MALRIRPPAGTKLPEVKCPYGCHQTTAGWAWTWGTNKKGRFGYTEHPVCDGCGTASIRIIKEKKAVAKPKPSRRSKRLLAEQEEMIKQAEDQVLEAK